jgi:hypothetical protein
MDFKLATPFLEAFEELDKLSEGARTAEDPYGYGPYKVPTDPKLKVGDYIKAKRYSSDTEWYPARVTKITPDFVDYTISGFGFIKNGTAVRSASAKQAFGNLRKRLLGEAANDPAKVAASKKFWSSAKMDKMEEDAFHIAFDDELKELGLMDIFDANGVLAKGVYGRIAEAKEAHPDSWAIKALGKLWALRWKSYNVDNIFKSEKEAREAKWKAAEEEKARKLEEQKRIRAEKLKKYQQLMLTYLRKVDTNVVDQYEEVTGTPVLDSVTVEEEFILEQQWTENLDQEYRVCFEGWDRCYKLKESKLNDEAYMLKTLKTGLEKTVEHSQYKDAVEEFKQEIDVLAGRNPKHQVLLLGDSGTTYELEFRNGELRMSIDGEDSILAEKIDEPYEIIYAGYRWSNHSDRTNVDNEDGAFYSWNSKYASILGDRIPRSFGRKDGFMGTYSETTKLTGAQAVGPNFCHADGIDSWAKYYAHETATD